MKKLTLQWRITILNAMVLLVCTVTLTSISMHNVQPLFWLAGGTPEIDYTSFAGEETPVPVQPAKMQFDSKSILFCALFTVLSTVAVYFFAGHALQPLRNLSGKVETVVENNLSIRLPEAVSHDEISRLTNGFDHMLSRLDDAFLRQKRLLQTRPMN